MLSVCKLYRSLKKFGGVNTLMCLVLTYLMVFDRVASIDKQ